MLTCCKKKKKIPKYMFFRQNNFLHIQILKHNLSENKNTTE